MLIRALFSIEPPSLRRRIDALLADDDLLIPTEGTGDLADRLARESCDLIIASETTLGELTEEKVAAIRALPDRPEIILLVETEDPVKRASFQAAGAFATVNARLGDDDLRRSLVALVKRRRETAMARFRGELVLSRGVSLQKMSTKSATMRQLIDLAGRLARTDSSLLITGETGVGKEWIARAVHSDGPRSGSPFIAINCAALPDTLLESELFGHEKGAFTGAIRARRGFFELAHRGTLFLDEIGEVPHHLQAKLLRVLQDRNVQRIGSEQLVEVDVRIIAATNHDLDRAMATGSFRKDLYYRLGVVTLNVPPLRERREDIADIARDCLDKLRFQTGHHMEGFTPSALEALTRYDWPGNVRELINVIERAVLLSSGTEITASDLPGAISRIRVTPDAPEKHSTESDLFFDIPLAQATQSVVDAFEQRYLSSLLRETYGSIAGTAARAGIDTRTLFNKMRRLGLRKETFRSDRH